MFSCLIANWGPIGNFLLWIVLWCGISPGKNVPRTKARGGFMGGFLSVSGVDCKSGPPIGLRIGAGR